MEINPFLLVSFGHRVYHSTRTQTRAPGMGQWRLSARLGWGVLCGLALGVDSWRRHVLYSDLKIRPHRSTVWTCGNVPMKV